MGAAWAGHAMCESALIATVSFIKRHEILLFYIKHDN
jgi:hypothetical protein